MSNIYNQNLEKNSANYQPLTPITFLERAASVYPERVAVIYGKQEYNYSEFYRRCRQLASFLSKKRISFGDTVSVPLSNTQAFGSPLCGAYVWRCVALYQYSP